ncbi:D-2-hydroxyacid dehydrogenase family protein [Bifidobacterium gallicum]|nr:D-2-hydroxyacid dehydrogenase family protein [Bifidobacterium gallicum]EFA22803.1 4-phosphoerythronate dehydrogenase [Bifidobacterium gallicum DSM 20093 = LMG 11596]
MPYVVEGMIEPFKQWFPMLKDVARLRMYEDYTLDPAEFLTRAADADALMDIGMHISDDMLEQLATHVKCIAFGGTGVASYIDLDRAKQVGLRVCNIVHYGDHAVAEFAIALMFELARHVGELDTQLREGNWSGMDGMQLYGKKLAIIGLGGIGKVVAHIANGLGMQVLAWNSHTSPEDFAAENVTPVDSMEELVAQADVVSIHMPLFDSTRGIITKQVIDAIRPGTLFINTARAEVIEPGALEARLLKGDVPAALDVFEQEPLPKDSPLLTIPGLILTPHVAWRTDGAYHELTRQVVQDIVSFFKGERFNVVD